MILYIGSGDLLTKKVSSMVEVAGIPIRCSYARVSFGRTIGEVFAAVQARVEERRHIYGAIDVLADEPEWWPSIACYDGCTGVAHDFQFVCLIPVAVWVGANADMVGGLHRSYTGHCTLQFQWVPLDLSRTYAAERLTDVDQQQVLLALKRVASLAYGLEALLA